MHADANTTATNNGNITIAVTGDAGETLSAGMQAVRGGSIVNGSGKNITVSAEGSAYGMMAISGSNGGKNFTDVESAVDNRGSITVTPATPPTAFIPRLRVTSKTAERSRSTAPDTAFSTKTAALTAAAASSLPAPAKKAVTASMPKRKPAAATRLPTRRTLP